METLDRLFFKIRSFIFILSGLLGYNIRVSYGRLLEILLNSLILYKISYQQPLYFNMKYPVDFHDNGLVDTEKAGLIVLFDAI
jgi:hypothetical protein